MKLKKPKNIDEIKKPKSIRNGSKTLRQEMASATFCEGLTSTSKPATSFHFKKKKYEKLTVKKFLQQ
ncbi:hypothetical protein [uncultured Methanobrevibacter sp.]|uniref:hypothetical protein n=1 Tax=uncultured Methanobrevibacter sp. TaxID=253161 RepID=UPI0025DD667A|nr:hypothetical protein [uncultured Methanobrevibacter sp.]